MPPYQISSKDIYIYSNKIENLSNNIKKLSKQDKDEPVLTNSNRIMKAFSISSKSAGNKIEPYTSITNKFDTRTFTV